jgi:hypothetical protein
MSKYKESLINLESFIKNLGAGALIKDIDNLKEMISKYEDMESNAKEKASEILKDTMLYGDFYYEIEDWLTECLKGNITELPYGIESEYLKCAIRVEVRDYFEGVNAEYTDEDIENVVDRLFNHFSESVLNQEFIESETSKYLIERNQEECNQKLF